MSRPSTPIRYKLQRDLRTLLKSGAQLSTKHLFTALVHVEKDSARQADAFTLRYWGITMEEMAAIVLEGRAEALEEKAELSFRDVGAKLNPPCSHTNAKNLVDRAFANVLIYLKKVA